MELISQSVSRLQSRKEAIEQELADIDSRFRAIAQALKVDGASDTSEPKPATSDGGKADGATKMGRKSNRWFAPGEAASLMKRYVRTPMTTSEIVKVLAHAKGFDNRLTGVQAKRFQATAYMARGERGQGRGGDETEGRAHPHRIREVMSSRKRAARALGGGQPQLNCGAVRKIPNSIIPFVRLAEDAYGIRHR